MEDLKAIFPNAPQEYLDAFISAENDLKAAGVNSPIRMAHFLSQIATETGGLKRLDESMVYTRKRLLEVFSSKRITSDKALEIGFRSGTDNRGRIAEQKIANWIYRNILGNGDYSSGDGWAYRGSGHLQLTGRGNFRDRGCAIGIDLVNNPDLARQAKAGLGVAIAYWQARNINKPADANDRLEVRRRVNGPAAHGYEQAVINFNRIWLKVFRNKAESDPRGTEFGEELATREALEVDENDLFYGILVELGYLSAAELGEEESNDNNKNQAVREFQKDFDIIASPGQEGALTAETEDALLNDTSIWRYQGLEEERDVFPSFPDLESIDVGRVFKLDTGASNQNSLESEEVLVPNPREGGSFAGESSTHDGRESSSTTCGSETSRAGTETAVLEEAAPEELSKLLPSEGTNKQVAPEDVALSEAELERLGEASGAEAFFQSFSQIGPDTRGLIDKTDSFPERAIVQILFDNAAGKPSLCSGAMISENAVLTAAHCVHSGLSSGVFYKNFQVFPGRNLGAAPYGSCSGNEVLLLEQWWKAKHPEEARFYDLAVLRLDCNIGKQTGWFGVRALSDTESGVATAVQGYASDQNRGQQVRSEDKVRLIWELKGFYDNDTVGGTSGAPVFNPNDESFIFGVHTHGLHGEGPWRVHNSFTRLTPSRVRIIESWVRSPQ